MKKFVLLLSVAVLCVSGCRVSDKREVTVKVPAMSSEADIRIIRGALNKLEGIDKEKTHYDLATHSVVVVYESMVLAHKNIEIAIAEAGYDANEIKAITTGGEQ